MNPDQKTKLACPLRAAAKYFAKSPAIITDDTHLSYAELDTAVSEISHRLIREGIRPGQRIAVLSWNSWESVALVFAIMRLGAVACPVSPRFPVETIVSILQKIDCTEVIDGVKAIPPMESSDLRTLSLPVLFETVGCFSDNPTTERQRDDESRLEFYDEFVPGQPATIVLTSGTTALPKAVLHAYANHYYSALGANKNIPIHPGCRWLLSLPLFHVGGLGIAFRMFLGGGAVVVPPSKQPVGISLERYGVTHLSLVATQLYRLLEEDVDRRTLRRLEAVLVGGGPVPSSLVRRAQQAGIPLHTTYGLTEMASQVTATAPDAPPEELATSGTVLPYRHVAVKGEEICVKGETLFKGYVEGQETVCPLDDEGWFRTGDLGSVDGRGRLTWHGRRDNMFISGGENICPEEIERCLCALPEIRQAIVVPVEHAEFGFRPVAFVQTAEYEPRNEKIWTEHLKKHLPKFKIPEAFYEWPEERNTGGIKPNRRNFEQQAKTLHERIL